MTIETKPSKSRNSQNNLKLVLESQNGPAAIQQAARIQAELMRRGPECIEIATALKAAPTAMQDKLKNDCEAASQGNEPDGSGILAFGDYFGTKLNKNPEIVHEFLRNMRKGA